MKKINSGTDFFTSKASLVFTWLKNTFTKAPILHYFDPECHIKIETSTSSYAMSIVPSQLTTKRGFVGQMTHKTNDLNPPSEISQWYLIALFFQKMISAKTHYKTHD